MNPNLLKKQIKDFLTHSTLKCLTIYCSNPIEKNIVKDLILQIPNLKNIDGRVIQNNECNKFIILEIEKAKSFFKNEISFNKKWY